MRSAVASLDPALFAAAPMAVRRRALVRLLLAIGGEDYPPRHERVERLAAAMEAHQSGRFKRTLAGAVIERRAGRFVFYREIGRAGLPSVAVKAGFDRVWDHRFRVTVGRGAPRGLTLGPLGEEGRRAVGAGAGTAPAGALAALPALRKGGRNPRRSATLLRRWGGRAPAPSASVRWSVSAWRSRRSSPISPASPDKCRPLPHLRRERLAGLIGFVTTKTYLNGQ